MGLPLAGFEVVNLGLIFADRIILQHYRSLSEVGVYSLAYTFGTLMLTLTVSLSQVWSPLFFESSIAGEIETLRRTSSSLITSLVAAASVAVVVARPAVHVLLDRRYFATAALIPIILAAYLANSFYYLFELQALQQKRTNIIVVVTLVACLLNIGLNIWFVPKWGMFGAAVATLAAYLVQACVMYTFVRAQAKHLYSAKVILASLAIFAGVLTIAEVDWATDVARYLMPASLLVAFMLLWPLGLNRVANILRSALVG
jgi:O-antigen/teichoic acid export membrane protein